MPEPASLTIAVRPPDRQLLLHCHPADTSIIERCGGVRLGSGMLRSMRSGDWHALHLAPDEWLLVSDVREARLDDLAAAGVPHSLVDVSERTAGRILTGAAAIAVLSAVCPIDLERLDVGYCTRSLLGKITAVIWRKEEGWRIDFPRSYESYVDGLLSAATAGLPLTA